MYVYMLKYITQWLKNYLIIRLQILNVDKNHNFKRIYKMQIAIHTL